MLGIEVLMRAIMRAYQITRILSESDSMRRVETRLVQRIEPSASICHRIILVKVLEYIIERLLVICRTI